MHVIAVLNQDGGTLRTMDLKAFCIQAELVFSRHGHTLECRTVSGADIQAGLESAVETPGLDAILAGGGDGTISAAASIAFGRGVPLGILPAGTMNLFARALGIPLDLHQALEAIAAGEVDSVDIATANGRTFVHQFGVGVHARLVRIREQMTYASRVGKMLASLRAIASAVINPPRFEAEIHTGRGTENRVAAGIAVSNNPLGTGPLPFAERLDTGMLGVYVADTMTTRELVQLAFDILLGTWRQSPLVSEKEVDEVTLHFPKRKKDAQAVIDGELINLEPVVRLKIHPRGLNVIRPRVG